MSRRDSVHCQATEADIVASLGLEWGDGGRCKTCRQLYEKLTAVTRRCWSCIWRERKEDWSQHVDPETNGWTPPPPHLKAMTRKRLQRRAFEEGRTQADMEAQARALHLSYDQLLEAWE